MKKDKNTNMKDKDIKKVKDVVETGGIEDIEEVLPEDVKAALGMDKAEKAAKIKEIDYISELESGVDEFDIDEPSSKSSFDDDFGPDLD